MASRSTTPGRARASKRARTRVPRPAAARRTSPKAPAAGASVNGAGGGAAWKAQQQAWASKVEVAKPREGLYPFTISGIPIKPLYGPEDVAHRDLARDLSFPGEYPYTRGVHPTMYRGRMFTMRQFAGFGTARETNQRFH